MSPAPLSVTAANAGRLYGDANPAFTGTITGVKNNDAITATYSSVADQPVRSVHSPLCPRWWTLLRRLINYSVLVTNGILTVSPAPLTVAGANATRIYGDPNPPLSGTITGIKNADNITATFASTATATSASAAIPSRQYWWTRQGNWATTAVTSTNGTLTVSPASLVADRHQCESRLWRSKPGLHGTIVGIKNGDNITATFASAATAASAVGSYPIVPTLADPTSKLGNYNVTSNNGTLTVSPAALTVTAADGTRVYGDPNPAFTGSISGLKNNDNITATFGSTAVAGSAVGAYPIIPSRWTPH